MEPPLRKLAEILPQPSKKKDVSRLIAGVSILGANLAYRIEGGSYNTPRQALIYTASALAIGLAAMPMHRFSENYYGNLKYLRARAEHNRELRSFAELYSVPDIEPNQNGNNPDPELSTD